MTLRWVQTSRPIILTALSMVRMIRESTEERGHHVLGAVDTWLLAGLRSLLSIGEVADGGSPFGGSCRGGGARLVVVVAIAIALSLLDFGFWWSLWHEDRAFPLIVVSPLWSVLGSGCGSLCANSVKVGRLLPCDRISKNRFSSSRPNLLRCSYTTITYVYAREKEVCVCAGTKYNKEKEGSKSCWLPTEKKDAYFLYFI